MSPHMTALVETSPSPHASANTPNWIASNIQHHHAHLVADPKCLANPPSQAQHARVTRPAGPGAKSCLGAVINLK